LLLLLSLYNCPSLFYKAKDRKLSCTKSKVLLRVLFKYLNAYSDTQCVVLEVSKSVEEYLREMDDYTISIILAIGKGSLDHTKVQKLSYVASQLVGLETDAEAYNYGVFSETIMEQLQHGYLRDLIEKDTKSKTYKLTETGKKLYDVLVEKIKRKLGNLAEHICAVLEVLRTRPDKEVLAFTYFLFPESAEKSKIKEEVDKTISSLFERSKKIIRKLREEKGSKIVELQI